MSLSTYTLPRFLPALKAPEYFVRIQNTTSLQETKPDSVFLLHPTLYHQHTICLPEI